MQRICEECLRPLASDRCEEHPFARPLQPDDPADLELLQTLRRLRAARVNQALLIASGPASIAALTAVLVLVAEMTVLNGFVWALTLLLGGGLALLPVLPVLWVLGTLGQDAVDGVRRRLGLLAPAAVDLLPEAPVLDPIRAAEEARAARTARLGARAPQSTGPRFLH